MARQDLGALGRVVGRRGMNHSQGQAAQQQTR
jgi:hypothetical protein